MTKRYLIYYFIAFLLFVFSEGCKVNYSLTGASISPEVKTISIKYFQNRAPLVQPTLSQRFTDALKDKFTSQTNLLLINNGGDLHVEGEIASLNRLSVSINVRFTNRFNEKQNYETTFTRYQDYDSKLSLSSVEDALLEEINEQLVEDIFNKAVVNW